MHQGLILPFEGVSPKIADDAFIAPGAVVIGATEIGAGTGIWYQCVLRGDVETIRIGARVNVQDGTVIHVSGRKFPTRIGDDVSIGHQALVHGCVLEPNSFVGMRAVVMDGCVIESGAMLAAGALLTPGKRIPAGQLWAGSPAKYMRDMGDAEREMARHTASHYAELAQRHRAANAANAAALSSRAAE